MTGPPRRWDARFDRNVKLKDGRHASLMPMPQLGDEGRDAFCTSSLQIIGAAARRSARRVRSASCGKAEGRMDRVHPQITVRPLRGEPTLPNLHPKHSSHKHPSAKLRSPTLKS